jgi:hypothetical protein
MALDLATLNTPNVELRAGKSVIQEQINGFYTDFAMRPSSVFP